MQPFALESDRLILDAPTADDVDDIARYCKDPVFERYMTTPWPYERADAMFFIEEFVARGWADGRELTWALRLTAGGPLLGVIGLRLPIAEFGFWLGAEHRGRGFMPEAVGAVADMAFETKFGDSPDATPARLAILEVRWECISGNYASAAVAHKTGFTFSGTGPSRLPGRDGFHPPSWSATLSAGDSRDPKPGWTHLERT